MKMPWNKSNKIPQSVQREFRDELIIEVEEILECQSHESKDIEFKTKGSSFEEEYDSVSQKATLLICNRAHLCPKDFLIVMEKQMYERFRNRAHLEGYRALWLKDEVLYVLGIEVQEQETE